MDYNESPGAFFGISEVELSQLLLDATDRTQNVTAIFDCCHSGRMVRDPRGGKEAIRRNIPTTRHHDIASHIEQLRQTGVLRERTISNPHAVRIAAAAPWESAYEYQNVFGERVGAFTEALVRVMEEADDDNMSWKTTMHRVQELVNTSTRRRCPPFALLILPFDADMLPNHCLFPCDRAAKGMALLTTHRVFGQRAASSFPGLSQCPLLSLSALGRDVAHVRLYSAHTALSPDMTIRDVQGAGSGGTSSA
ncbi:hypothetical protein BJX65DRAFT_306167 [Aspergillus insuetus]